MAFAFAYGHGNCNNAVMIRMDKKEGVRTAKLAVRMFRADASPSYPSTSFFAGDKMLTRQLEPNYWYFARAAYRRSCGCVITGVVEFSTYQTGRIAGYGNYFYPDCRCGRFPIAASEIAKIINDDDIMDDEQLYEWQYWMVRNCNEPYHVKCSKHK